MAGEYHLQLSTSPEISKPRCDRFGFGTTPSTYYIRAVPLPAGQYYWSMQVMIGGTYGNWMPVQTFTVSPIPVAPALDQRRFPVL